MVISEGVWLNISLEVTDPKRYKSLDAIRGIAALFVLFSHYFQGKLVPWNFFLAGSESVIIFFMLSGFVLSSLLFHIKMTYYTYIIRRILRIYPVYIVILLGIVFILFLFKKNVVSPEDHSIDYGQYLPLIKNLILIYKSDNRYIPASWTLYFEMIISVFFPLLFTLYLYKINSKIFELMSIGILCLIGLYLHNTYAPIPLLSVPYYTVFFILGIMIFKYKETLKKYVGIKILIFSLIIYFSRFSFFGIYSSEALRNFFTGCGSFIIIYHAIYYSPFSNFLNNRALVFLGKISYPLYLMHYPILRIITYISSSNNHFLTDLQLRLLSILVTLWLSNLISNFVERPIIKFSKKF